MVRFAGRGTRDRPAEPGRGRRRRRTRRRRRRIRDPDPRVGRGHAVTAELVPAGRELDDARPGRSRWRRRVVGRRRWRLVDELGRDVHRRGRIDDRRRRVKRRRVPERARAHEDDRVRVEATVVEAVVVEAVVVEPVVPVRLGIRYRSRAAPRSRRNAPPRRPQNPRRPRPAGRRPRPSRAERPRRLSAPAPCRPGYGFASWVPPWHSTPVRTWGKPTPARVAHRSGSRYRLRWRLP